MQFCTGYRYFLLLLFVLIACAGSGDKKFNSDLLTIDEEVEYGNKLAAEVDRQFELIDDAEITGYCTEIGTQISKNSDWAGLKYTFRLINTGEIYHFSLPGGHIYLTRGLIAEMTEACEAAAIMAFEIANVVGRNVTHQLVNKFGNAIFSQSVVGENPEIWQNIVSDLYTSLTILQFSDNENREADRLALMYLHKSKIDPAGLVKIYKKIYEMGLSNPQKVSKLLFTQMPTKARISRIEKQISKLAVAQNYGANEQAFQDIKIKLAQMTGAGTD